MGFNFSALVFGGGSSSGAGVAKYPTASSLPLTAQDGDVAIVLDTNVLYSYDTGVAAWVVIGGPGVAVTASDSDSILVDSATNNWTWYLNIPGFTTIPTGFNGVTLSVYSGSSPGLVANIKGYPVYGQTSSTWNITGSTTAIMGATLKLEINDASPTVSGIMTRYDQSFAGIKYFNNLIIGWSGIGLPKPSGPETIYLNAPTVVTSSYNLYFPKDIGTTWGFWQADGQGGITIAQLNLGGTFLTGITGPVIANGPGVGVAVMQAGGITLSNLTGIDPSTFLGNPTGATAGVTTITVAVAKSLLGISNNNFGDVTLGNFSYNSFAQGLTLTTAQVLTAGWGDTTNPGMIGPTHQVWSGDKDTTGNLGTFSYLRFRGASLVSIGSTATSGYTLILPLAQGSTFSELRNNGLGDLSWSYALNGKYTTVTNAGATLQLIDRFIEVTTGVTNQTLNVGWGTGNTNLIFNVMKIDSGLGTVTLQSDRGINGATNFVIANQWESHLFVDNGIGIRVIT